ncbi:hypothetical protein Xmau_02103 [Xenorhabdus mauleonii]|uniref:Uncharacterized protein n=1 Tax=Xenorhabdus mauleonii TaxID=351675 RepID=A0A1I3QLT1_9GAMM|nr:hypothetical protein [Xenorhabdus mauleonii]PHM39921.1 hypothetical protein Xmau_02103 [Xenorhabdus mauleonii]SFJ34489.1 hypothetical protein SAMN05421680_107204 [Xenorhabdus mauleonii]
MIRYILHQAIEHAHLTFSGKTSNIFYNNPECQPESRRNRYSTTNCQIRERKFSELTQKLNRFGNARNKYNCIMEEKKHDNFLVGNCTELSITALMYLAEIGKNNVSHYFRHYSQTSNVKNIQPIYIEILAPVQASSYHCFVMIYSPSCISDYQFQNKNINPLYKTYDKLPNGAWVCDPWAEIVCLSENYDSHWRNTMNNWADQGKYLSLGNAPAPSLYKPQHPPSRDPCYPLYSHTLNMMSNTAMQVNHQAIIKTDNTSTINHSHFEYANC